MLVHVMRLREQGRKLQRETVMMRGAKSGRLRLQKAYPNGPDPHRLRASLYDAHTNEPVFAPLDRARVTVIDERGILIVGDEVDGSFGRPRTYRQAWWVVAVGASA